MLHILLILWLLFFPVVTSAQETTPTDTPTPTITETVTPTPTPTSTPEPTATPAPTSTTAPSSPTSTPVPAATSKPVTLPTKKQSATTTQQSGGFGGDGLVEEKDTPNQGGLSNGQTLGTATLDVSNAGDKDLLGTLIFLTAAVVLVVWTTYAVLVQRGIIKTEKKTKNQSGITPQPLD